MTFILWPSERRKRQRWEAHVEQGGECYYCGIRVPFIQSTLDHIKPRSKGGKDYVYNTVMACFHCNKAKKNMSIERFLKSNYLKQRQTFVARQRAKLSVLINNV